MKSDIKPIFVVSSVRSGSTLLRLMLDAHPQISNPGECDFLFDQVSDQGRHPDKFAYHEWLLTNRIFLAHGLIQNKSNSFLDEINSFISQMAKKGDVLTMNIHRHFYRIVTIFPQAKFIHLVRDPRDVARSCIGMGWCGHPYYGVDIWADAESSWDVLKPALREDQYLELRYEDLLEDIGVGLSQICEFLGVAYSDQMLKYDHNSTYSLPDKRLCFQWKKKYSQRELQLVEGKVSGMLLARGYELGGESRSKPKFLEELILWCENKKYIWKFRINKYGFRIFISEYISRKVGSKYWSDLVRFRINEIDRLGLK